LVDGISDVPHCGIRLEAQPTASRHALGDAVVPQQAALAISVLWQRMGFSR
jgi:hypothetical protein